VLLTSSNVPPLAIPPPKIALLPLIVLSKILSVHGLEILPPSLLLFPLIVQLVMVNVPALLTPPPLPPRIVKLASVTRSPALKMPITVPEFLASMIVVRALAPMIVRLTGTVRCSAYVAAGTTIVSPDLAREIACPTVLQGVVDDVQLWLSLPLTPFTYQVLAIAAGTKVRDRTINITLEMLGLMTCLQSSPAGAAESDCANYRSA
jgi:hypothetical protein